jgi:uncharacterized membrane protein (UPF0127 family)
MHRKKTIDRIVRWTARAWRHIFAFENSWGDTEVTRKFGRTGVANDTFRQAVNVTKDSLVVSRVHLALTPDERRRGFLGRRILDPDEGLYIAPTQWIHMFGMNVSIDVAFLSSGGRVLHVHRDFKPNRFSRLVWWAEGALELPAGTLAASETEVGDTIQLRLPAPESRHRHVIS